MTTENEGLVDLEGNAPEAETPSEISEQTSAAPPIEADESSDADVRIEALEAELMQARALLSEETARADAAQRALEEAEEQRALDALLIEAQAIDLESARLLVRAAVEQSTSRDLAATVRELQRSKPFLFRARVRHSAAMSPDAPPEFSPVEKAATEAARTGDRASLLRYLRVRRTN